MKRLRRGALVLAAMPVCLMLASARPGGAVAHSSLVHSAGYMVAQGAKDAPPCSGVCYSPAQIQAAYDFPTGKKELTGAGQTILIVVPYGSATIEADLATFDSTFGIAPLASLSVVDGTSAGGVGSGDLITWGVETSVSVEYAHALAPDAKIVVAVSPTDDIADVVATESQILPLYPGAIVTQSFGDDETDPAAQADFQALHAIFAAATARGGTILAPAGDFGATDCPDASFGCGDNPPVASYPASDPLVTGVGGTEGNPYPGGLLRGHDGYGGEQVWNEGDTFGVATGGAPSVIFHTPAYQQGISGNNSFRTVPDVSYNAAINGGIEFYFGPIGFKTFGGTSAGPPQWAAIIALADEARQASGRSPLGVANTALYAIARDRGDYRDDFHDITVGTNALGSFPGFPAGPGYDLASGLGTPDVSKLVHDLVEASQPSAPKPADVNCTNQQLSGAYHDVRVRKGSWCDLSGATVFGDVHAEQASGLGITGSTIQGDLHGENLTGAADPSHPGTNVICSSSIRGDVHIQESRQNAPWTIGGAGCANSIGHDLHFENNRAGGVISGNTIQGNLQCHGNGPLTGGGNEVGGKANGQCAVLAGAIQPAVLSSAATVG